LYLPTPSDDTARDIITNTLSEVENVIINFPKHSIICCGDFNVNLQQPSRDNIDINDFMVKHDLQICTSVFQLIKILLIILISMIP
jgi:hypothetical protein